TATVRVYTGDWRRLPEGDHVYLEPATLERSASRWIQVAPSEFLLESEGRNTVRFTVSIPEEVDLQGTHWSMLFFESSGRPAQGAGSNVRVVQRIGVKV